MTVCSGRPDTAYFRNKEVSGVLGDGAGYALVPDDSALRRDLYQWLGVQSRPRITDMLRIVDLKRQQLSQPTGR